MYVCLIGGEGSGKTTVFRRLRQDFLTAQFVNEPSRDIGIASAILDALYNERNHPSATARAQFFLYMAARVQLMDESLRVHLAAGGLGIADRAYDSTYVYQVRQMLGWTSEADFDWYLDLLKRFDIPLADIMIRLDLDPAIGLARKAGQPDTNFLDRESLEFHRGIREAYSVFCDLVEKKTTTRVITIDADQSPDNVYASVKAALTPYLCP